MVRDLDLDDLVAQLLRAASARDLRIGTAESCSGGMIASLLTDVEGLGHVFERGFVTYSDEAKIEMLGIAPALIEENGAVSAAVARAMVTGALTASGADLALAITGFAGPAGAEDEEGLVYLAALRGARMETLELHLGAAGRDAVRRRSACEGIRLMLRLIGEE